MDKFNLDYIVALQRKNEHLKSIANKLANQLIIEFDINEGYQISHFLKINSGLDNYSAVRVWVQKSLIDRYSLASETSSLEEVRHDDTLYTQLKNQFLNHFPETAIA